MSASQLYRTAAVPGNDQRIYGGFSIKTSQNPPTAVNGSANKTQQSTSPSVTNIRPNSAGATRTKTSLGSYATNPQQRTTTGTTNIYLSNNSGISGQGYQTSSNTGGSKSPLPAGQNAAASNINSLNYNAQSTQGQSTSKNRPRSAGATRTTPIVNSASNNPVNAAYMMNSNHISAQEYVQHVQQQQQQQQKTEITVNPLLNQTYYGYSNTNVAGPSGVTSTRPLSANATSHTSIQHSHNANAYATDQWSSAYKLHYGYNAGAGSNIRGPSATGPVSQNGTTNAININYQQDNTSSNRESNSRPTSAAAIKLRDAVDLSHKFDATKLANEAVMKAVTAKINTNGGEDEDLENKLDAENNLDGQVKDDDDEMDGKPITESRSHPEVSTSTPYQSVELANGSGLALGGVLDARTTSLDSFTDEQIDLGVSTLPNQFCTKRDALELKKLLTLSMGTRGGIVPSSSAVMDMYMVGKVVGVGSYGKVRAAWHRLTAQKVAIKTYDKAKLKDPAHWKRVHSEIKIMEQISHPRIARMYEAVETPKRMHLIMECLDGGNLCSYVKAKKRLTEEESRRIFFQIIQAIEHLHALGVSHRDVKLENVLFENDKDIKLIDFGFSTVCQAGKKLKVFCGTPSYMAPEIVRRSEYEGKPVDIWSMGILLYALLCGCFPFRAKAYPDLYRRIARGTFAIPDELSAPVKDLLRQLLNVDATTRITAYAAIRHPWLQMQLINAPNIDKMRLENPILISDKPSDDLDDQVIAEIEKFGMPRDEIIRLVMTKTHSSLATFYYLLLDSVIKKRRAASKKGGPLNMYSSNSAKYKNIGITNMNINTMAGAANGSNLKNRPTPSAEQIQQQYQTQIDYSADPNNNDYRFARPSSATATNRPNGSSGQRPLSAFAGRR